MKFRPLHDRVVLRRLEGEEKTKGGIIIPDTAKEKPQEGEVVAVGPGGRDEAGKLLPIDLKPGDRVLFGKWSGTEVKIDGEELLIMKEFLMSWECSKAPRPAGRSHRLAVAFHQFNLGEPKWLPRMSDFPPMRGTRCCMASMSSPTLSG